MNQRSAQRIVNQPHSVYKIGYSFMAFLLIIFFISNVGDQRFFHDCDIMAHTSDTFDTFLGPLSSSQRKVTSHREERGRFVYTHLSPFFSSYDRSRDTSGDLVCGSRGRGHGASDRVTSAAGFLKGTYMYALVPSHAILSTYIVVQGSLSG